MPFAAERIPGLSSPTPASGRPVQPVSATSSESRRSSDRQTGSANRRFGRATTEWSVQHAGAPPRSANSRLGIAWLASNGSRSGLIVDSRERIGLHVHGLFVEMMVELARQRRHRRLDHGEAAAGFQHPRRFLEEFDRALQMMQDVEHHDARKRSGPRTAADAHRQRHRCPETTGCRWRRCPAWNSLMWAVPPPMSRTRPSGQLSSNCR